ncbi:MAG: TonB-dependent receptor [Bacteroidales bacterium]|nr:TonB-dependent receptor [Bacteroidales bacterium]
MKRIRLFFTVMVMLLASASAFAQNMTVSGVVTDSNDVPLIGATVMVEGTQTGTSTDVDGAFSLTAPKNGTLVVSVIGYATKNIPVNGQSFIAVQLEEDAEFLDATIVIGYGSGQKIGNIVGSVATVSSDEIASRPSGNISDALQGKVAGLQIFNSSGEPQSSVSIKLRGTSSLNLSNAPLYILDGVPVSSSVFSTLNPQDIENISILKDASSTAIYGSRAANGVIYISTKKGKKGEKATVSVRAQYGVSTLTKYNFDMMNAEELIRFEEICDPVTTSTPEYQARKAFILGNNIDFDWLDYLYDSAAPVMQADASLRGATETTNYYVSLGYYSEEGTYKYNSGMDRFNIRANLDTQIAKWLKFGINLSLSYKKYSTITTGWYSQSPILVAVTELPYRTPYEIIHNPDGTISFGDVKQTYDWNGTMDLHEYYKNTYNNKDDFAIMGQTYFLLTPMKGLTIRAAQAIDAYDYTSQSVANPSFTPYTYRGRTSRYFERYYQLSSTNTIEYKTDINQDHFFTALLGHESLYKNSRFFSATGTGLTDDRLVEFAATTDIESWDGYTQESAFNSFFANFNYSYRDRYFVDASVRTDGSSLFGRNHRYATFYSVGGMWKAKNEAFLQDAHWLNDLSLSVSYGTTGNSGLSSWYASQGLVGTGPKYNGNAGWALAQVPNADLTWETVATLNVGLRARFFDRFGVGVEFYDKASSDLLMEIPYSGTTGHSGGWGNIAAMTNRGVDLEVDVDLIHTRNIYWGVRANVNYNKNEITKLYQGLDELAFPDAGLKYQVGKSSTLVYTQIFGGVDPLDGNPMWYDLNGNLTKTFSNEIMQFWGDDKDATAAWSGGFSTNFSWKGLGINADFSWVGDRWIWMNEYYYTRNPQNQLFNSNFERKMLGIWQKPGDVTDIPKYGTTFQFDTSVYSNASFLRLKNLSISYSFPKALLEKTNAITGLKVYATARNLWTVTGFEGYDPEVGYSNGTAGLYPNSRQIVFGAEITF